MCPTMAVLPGPKPCQCLLVNVQKINKNLKMKAIVKVKCHPPGPRGLALILHLSQGEMTSSELNGPQCHAPRSNPWPSSRVPQPAPRQVSLSLFLQPPMHARTLLLPLKYTVWCSFPTVCSLFWEDMFWFYHVSGLLLKQSAMKMFF